MHIKGDHDSLFYNVDVNAPPFLTATYAWVKEWMGKRFTLQYINFITLSLSYEFSSLANEMFRVWLILNGSSPSVHNGHLTFYSTKSLDLFPHLPEFQIEFGQTAVLPIVKTSDFGVLGIRRDWVFLTKCANSHETMYKAACIRPCGENALKFVSDLPNFNFVVQFDLSCCNRLLSDHLEQVAIVCPNLQRLSLQSSENCLTSLQGLQSIATNCSNLQGLHLVGIGVPKNQVQFWEVLSCMRLTHLALDLCVTETFDETLIAIELVSNCISCYNVKVKVEESILVTHFPSLESCILSDIHLKGIQDILNNCKKLKYFKCNYVGKELCSSFNCCSLQELCIHFKYIHLTERFMNIISSHSGLVHVFVEVSSVSGEGITILVTNSPNLLTFHIYLKCFDLLGGLDQENFQVALREKFSSRKLFTMGGFKLEQKHYIAYEQHANLQSLWNFPFWFDVEVVNIPMATDTNTLADFDKYPDPSGHNNVDLMDI